jgi:hypothetical protein
MRPSHRPSSTGCCATQDNSGGRRGRSQKAPTYGTGGNGYAFLKLFHRTGDAVWLERARAFAITGIAQCREAREQLGRGRYSLWTGDTGLAVYLWDCLTALPRFPTVDVL